MPEDNDVYNRLAERYHQPGHQHFIDILKAMMTPEEGEIVLELITPATPEEVAGRLKKDEKNISEKMNNMAQRGLLFRGKKQYVAWGDSHQLNARVLFSADENIPPDLLRLRSEDQRYEGSPFDKLKARVIEEKCMGCGVCVISCKKEAMKFELIKPPDFIPPKPEMNFSMMPDLT